MPRDDAEQVHPENDAEWREWLLRHHDDSTGVWLVSWRSVTGRPSMSYEESVVEAVAFGWIDSLAKTLDDERSAMWYSPRRPGSPWSASNKLRVARLEAEGRMTDAGRRQVEIAKSDGTWTILDGAEALVVPDDLAAALGAHGARDAWDAQSPSVRRAELTKLALAKRSETRARHVERIATDLAVRHAR
jgi:uncharacterized protein YdeI (YjbR/CyaY-like superfamily)